MRDALEITDELIQLQRAVDAAFAALGEWDVPPSEWSAERREEWEARWQTYRTSVRVLAAHPVMRRAAEQRYYGRMQTALRRAARSPDVPADGTGTGDGKGTGAATGDGTGDVVRGA